MMIPGNGVKYIIFLINCNPRYISSVDVTDVIYEYMWHKYSKNIVRTSMF